MDSAYSMVYSSSAKHPEYGTITEPTFNKGAKYKLFAEISHKWCDPDKGP